MAHTHRQDAGATLSSPWCPQTWQGAPSLAQQGVGDQGRTYDAAGNLAVDENGLLHAYAFENRLIGVYNDVDANGQLDTQVDAPYLTYQYDALGWRIEMVDDSGATPVTTRYYYDGRNVLAEYDENDALRRRFVNGPTYIDERVAVYDAATAQEYYYLLTDLYTVTALADEGGRLVESYDYDSFGKVYVTKVRSSTRDADGDGDADLDDFQEFQLCFDPGQPVGPGCTWADVNGDATIDLSDLIPEWDCLSGPWYQMAAGADGDFNDDGLVDEIDVAAFHPPGCYTGPDVTPPPAGCEVFDFDGDDDVDYLDYATLGGLLYLPVGPLTTACLDTADRSTLNPYFFTGRRLDLVDTGALLKQVYYSRQRTYDPLHGRFVQRDPAGYIDGMNLYEYVESLPTRYVDPLGLWGMDVHHDLTLELARKAGIACAEEMAAGANRPDEDYRSPPPAGKSAGKETVIADRQVRRGKMTEDERALVEDTAMKLVEQAAEWHFPADPDGEVRPDSDVANAKVRRGIANCNFRWFSEGLHTLQDSWSHQGIPPLGTIGHTRGALFVPSWWGGYWTELSGVLAALSHSADDVTLWPADARATGRLSYQRVLDFKERCPCACPGPNGTKLPTSSKQPEDRDVIAKWLVDEKYPGQNIFP